MRIFSKFANSLQILLPVGKKSKTVRTLLFFLHYFLHEVTRGQHPLILSKQKYFQHTTFKKKNGDRTYNFSQTISILVYIHVPIYLNYHLIKKNSFVLVSKLIHLVLSLYIALLSKEINTVLVVKSYTSRICQTLYYERFSRKWHFRNQIYSCTCVCCVMFKKR